MSAISLCLLALAVTQGAAIHLAPARSMLGASDSLQKRYEALVKEVESSMGNPEKYKQSQETACALIPMMKASCSDHERSQCPTGDWVSDVCNGKRKPEQPAPSMEERVSPIAGCKGFECVRQYVNLPDSTYSWTDTGSRINGVDDETGIAWTGYILNMTSQTWSTPAQVDHPVWWHIMVMVVPEKLEFPNFATITLDFGINHKNGTMTRIDNRADFHSAPRSNPLDSIGINSDNMLSHLGDLKLAAEKAAYFATHTRTLGCSLMNLPNTHLTFGSDPIGIPRAADQIRGFTYNDFLQHTDQPERISDIPTVKAVVRAMDTLQAFTKSLRGTPVTDFAVAGYSKLGTATFMTGALQDPRVKAIIPCAHDLNWAEHLNRSNHLGIPEVARKSIEYMVFEEDMAHETERFEKIHNIIDMGAWRDRLTVPKFWIMSTNDAIFGPSLDASQKWIPTLPGQTSYLSVPNAIHEESLTHSLSSSSAWLRGLLLGKTPPKFNYSYEFDEDPRQKWLAFDQHQGLQFFGNGTATLTTQPIGDSVPTHVRQWTAITKPLGELEKGNWVSAELQETSPGSGTWKSSEHKDAKWGRQQGFFVEYEYEWPEPGYVFKISTPLWKVPKRYQTDALTGSV